jgi:predicted nucleotidyltransferase
MEKERVLHLIKRALRQDERVVFAYLFGSFVSEKSFQDIDMGIYIKNPEESPYVISSDIKSRLSHLAKEEGLNFIADQFDVRTINDAPFTFLNRVFREGILLVDRDPDLRTDVIEQVSIKYRECAGLLAEVSL